MITFIIGLVILFVGAALYGKFCEHVFGPDDRKTPAYTKEDGVDYVPMRGWKNSLINLLNIAGTGPILGPIQGILFGPIAFITIPIGNIIGGAMHDYFSGMICLRDGGTQMPDMIRRYSNKGVYTVYQIFCSLLLLLVGAVFIYTPGDIAATQVFGFDGAVDFPLTEIWEDWNAGSVLYGTYFSENHFIPIFFITVACGILSGFHSTQTAIISRTMKSEKQGRMTFYNMMILEGFIAMVWAAGAMGAYNLGLHILGPVGGIIALLGVIVLPITSGDTALRALRLAVADGFHLDQKSTKKRLGLAAVIFVLVAVILVFAKSNADGFNILWRYFAWSNQSLSLFAFLAITVWMFETGRGKYAWMPLIPGCWYAFVTVTYIVNAKIGFNVPWMGAYIIGIVAAAAYLIILVWYGKKRTAAKAAKAAQNGK